MVKKVIMLSKYEKKIKSVITRKTKTQNTFKCWKLGSCFKINDETKFEHKHD